MQIIIRSIGMRSIAKMVAIGLAALFLVPVTYAKSPYYNPSANAESKAKYGLAKDLLDKTEKRHREIAKTLKRLLERNTIFLEQRERALHAAHARWAQTIQTANKVWVDKGESAALTAARAEKAAAKAAVDALSEWKHPQYSTTRRDGFTKAINQWTELLRQQDGNLRASLRRYREALDTYTTVFVKRGPRYVKSAKISVDGRTYYHGAYEVDLSPSDAPDVAEIKRELQELAETLKERAEARAKAVGLLQKYHLKVADVTAKYSSEIWYSALRAVAIESAAVIVESAATGGLSTVARGTDLALDATKRQIASGLTKASPFDNIFKGTARELAEKSLAAVKRQFPGQEVEKAGLALLSAEAGKTSTLLLMDKRFAGLAGRLGLEPEDTPKGNEVFLTTLLSDTIEKTISIAPAAFFDYRASHAEALKPKFTEWKSHTDPIKGKVKLTNVQEMLDPKGLGIALSISLAKGVALQVNKNALDATQEEFVEAVATSGHLIWALDVHRAEDRKLLEQGERLEAALRDYEYRMKIRQRDATLELTRPQDDIFETARLGEGNSKVEIELLFSGTLDFPPTVSIAGVTAKTVQRSKAGPYALAWRAEIDLPNSVIREAVKADKASLPIEVGISEKETYSALDSEPETIALPKIFQEDWRLYEPGPDRRHRLKLKDELDLNGRWKIVGYTHLLALDVYAQTYVLRAIQDEDSLRIVYSDIPASVKALCRHPANRLLGCLREGDVFLEAKKVDQPRDEGLAFEGQIFLDRRIRACNTEKPTPVRVVVSTNFEMVRLEMDESPSESPPEKFNFCPVREQTSNAKPASMLHLGRRGSPRVESQLADWQARFAGAAQEPSTTSNFMMGAFSFLGIGERTTSGSVGEIVWTPNDGSQDVFWEMQSLAPYIVSHRYAAMNAAERERARRFAADEVAHVEGFAPVHIDMSTQGVREFLAERGVFGVEDLPRAVPTAQPAREGASVAVPTPQNPPAPTDTGIGGLITPLAPAPQPLEMPTFVPPREQTFGE